MYIRKCNYEYLNSLTPIKRFAENFRLETEMLDFEINTDDVIAGHFILPQDDRATRPLDDEKVDDELKRIMNAPSLFGSRTSVDRGHTLIDYESIINNGLIMYENKTECELKKYPDDEYLHAMKSSVATVKNFTDKIACKIAEKAEKCVDSERGRLYKIRDMIKKVPYYPAENFTEAVQSIWIIHFLIPCAADAWYSISLGKFDEYMYPFYKKSLADGMTREEAKTVLYNLYQLLNSYSDGACLLNVGCEYNELSELIIECQKEFEMPAPILGARVDENTPKHIWNMLIDEKLFTKGQPTFYGEKACIKALIEKGLSVEEAKQFSNNSCMGISIPGNEFNSMWGCVFSVSAALESAMNDGRPFDKDFTVPNIHKPKNIEELFENFEKCVMYMLTFCVKAYEAKSDFYEKVYPACFHSLLTPGCIENRCDIISGAKYHNATVECMGMINVADGIYAIDKLVFSTAKYTVNEINDAVKNNFNGFESIRNDIIKCSKFGQNSEADNYAVRVAEIMQKAIRNFSHDNLYYVPSLHTLDVNVGDGACWGAGYDGRYAGEPFAKNAGPSNNVRSSDPTSMILSVSSLPQYKFFGGQPIDVNFQTDIVKNHKDEIAALIKTYLDRGGLQFQVNSLSSKILRDAADNPEKYPGLVVRIGGYSLYFNNISKESKEEFIQRVEKEECLHV